MSVCRETFKSPGLLLANSHGTTQVNHFTQDLIDKAVRPCSSRPQPGNGLLLPCVGEVAPPEPKYRLQVSTGQRNPHTSQEGRGSYHDNIGIDVIGNRLIWITIV